MIIQIEYIRINALLVRLPLSTPREQIYGHKKTGVPKGGTGFLGSKLNYACLRKYFSTPVVLAGPASLGCKACRAT